MIAARSTQQGEIPAPIKVQPFDQSRIQVVSRSGDVIPVLQFSLAELKKGPGGFQTRLDALRVDSDGLHDVALPRFDVIVTVSIFDRPVVIGVDRHPPPVVTIQTSELRSSKTLTLP